MTKDKAESDYQQKMENYVFLCWIFLVEENFFNGNQQINDVLREKEPKSIQLIRLFAALSRIEFVIFRLIDDLVWMMKKKRRLRGFSGQKKSVLVQKKAILVWKKVFSGFKKSLFKKSRIWFKKSRSWFKKSRSWLGKVCPISKKGHSDWNSSLAK